MSIYFTDKLLKINPFSENGLYNDNWVELSITNSTEYQMITDKTIIFSFKISKLCEGWQLRAMDFIMYQKLYNRNVIVTAEKKDFEEAQAAYYGHSIYDKYLRSYEPEVLVHSTTPEAYLHIQEEGVLKSWNKLKSNNIINEDKPIGSLLGDPYDFSDYIMLGEGISIEIIVNSKEKGYINMDIDCEYTPGARFYFYTSQLISSGMLVRDGCHYKVKDALPINHALFCATIENVDMKENKITPKTFSQAADEAFAIWNKKK